jgi:hypothetical protein
MQKTWGIYKVSRSHTSPLNKWTEPCCAKCDHELEPWIDWWFSKSIGFCRNCNDLYVVNSKWKLSPEYHVRLEISELVGHEVEKLDLKGLRINVKKIISLHDLIPLEIRESRKVEKILRRLKKYKSQKSKLLQYLVWSLIFNSKEINRSIIKDYVNLIYMSPHYSKIYGKNEIWIGDEFDVVKRLDKNYSKEIIEAVYSIWINEKQELDLHQFKTRLGFYITTDDSKLDKYDDEFVEFIKSIRQIK